MSSENKTTSIPNLIPTYGSPLGSKGLCAVCRKVCTDKICIGYNNQNIYFFCDEACLKKYFEDFPNGIMWRREYLKYHERMALTKVEKKNHSKTCTHCF